MESRKLQVILILLAVFGWAGFVWWFGASTHPKGWVGGNAVATILFGSFIYAIIMYGVGSILEAIAKILKLFGYNA